MAGGGVGSRAGSGEPGEALLSVPIIAMKHVADCEGASAVSGWKSSSDEYSYSVSLSDDEYDSSASAGGLESVSESLNELLTSCRSGIGSLSVSDLLSESEAARNDSVSESLLDELTVRRSGAESESDSELFWGGEATMETRTLVGSVRGPACRAVVVER